MNFESQNNSRLMIPRFFEKEHIQGCDTDAPVRGWMDLNTCSCNN